MFKQPVLHDRLRTELQTLHPQVCDVKMQSGEAESELGSGLAAAQQTAKAATATSNDFEHQEVEACGGAGAQQAAARSRA